MDRLTYDFQIGGSHCWQVKGADNLECREVCQRQEDRGCTDCPIAKAFDRLAAYEETGLEPEEMEQIKKAAAHMMFEDVAHFVRYTLSNFDELQRYKELGDYNRLHELAQADNEGRCVVLPFKPPRWVYMCSARFPKPAKAHYASAINVLQDMDNGCVFGDTPKEAEAALRREQDG